MLQLTLSKSSVERQIAEKEPLTTQGFAVLCLLKNIRVLQKWRLHFCCCYIVTSNVKSRNLIWQLNQMNILLQTWIGPYTIDWFLILYPTPTGRSWFFKMGFAKEAIIAQIFTMVNLNLFVVSNGLIVISTSTPTSSAALCIEICIIFNLHAHLQIRYR